MFDFGKVIDDLGKGIRDMTRSIVDAVQTQRTAGFSGYSVVFALSEHFINMRLAKTHNREAGAQHGLPWKLVSSDKTWWVVVEAFEPPQIDFNTEVRNGCRLKVKVHRGSFGTLHAVAPGEVPTVDTKKLDGMEIIATIDVSKIKHKGWAAGDLTVGSIFTELENVEDVDATLDATELAHTSTGVDVPIATLIHDELKRQGPSHPLRKLFGQIKLHHVAKSKPETRLVRIIKFMRFRLKIWESIHPVGHSYSTTVVRGGGSTYSYGVLNVLTLVGDQRTFPSSPTAGLISSSLAPNGQARVVVSDNFVLRTYAKPDAEKRWPGIPIRLLSGRFGEKSARYSIDEVFNFGVTVGGRGRNAYMRKDFEIEIVGNEIRYSGAYDTSRFRPWPLKDSKFSVSVDGERVTFWPDTVGLPGSDVFDIGNAWLDGQLYAPLTYKD